MLLMSISLFTACSGEDDSSSDDSSSTALEAEPAPYTDSELIRLLAGTSWKPNLSINKTTGKQVSNDENLILTLASNNKAYILNAFSNTSGELYGTWYISSGKLFINIEKGNEDEILAALRAKFAAHYSVNFLYACWGDLTIKSISNSYLTTAYYENYYSHYEYEFHYSKVPYTEGSNSGGSSTGYAPYVTSFDFTATKSSITVKFICNERPTSATVKYGTSSASSTISSSISGKQVTATVTGLRSGTKYYFKCTVKNDYGSSTSDTFTAITNY